MATSLTGRIAVSIVTALSNLLDLGTPKDDLAREYLQRFADGEGASQAEMVFHDQRTLAASATEDLDFAGGLTNAFGATITFKAIKAIFVRAAPGNTNNVVLTRPATNGLVLFAAASDALAGLKPGGMFLFTDPSVAGLMVTAGTGDLLNVSNSGAGSAVTYDLVVIGTV